MPGLDEITFDSINNCAVDIKQDLFKNIVLVGGNTLFPGIAQRIKQELNEKNEPKTKIKIFAPPKREISVWIGGSLLVSLSTFSRIYITKEQYKEHGTSIIHHHIQS